MTGSLPMAVAGRVGSVVSFVGIGRFGGRSTSQQSPTPQGRKETPSHGGLHRVTTLRLAWSGVLRGNPPTQPGHEKTVGMLMKREKKEREKCGKGIKFIPIWKGGEQTLVGGHVPTIRDSVRPQQGEKTQFELCQRLYCAADVRRRCQPRSCKN